jgi:hypothetical protein
MVLQIWAANWRRLDIGAAVLYIDKYTPASNKKKYTTN